MTITAPERTTAAPVRFSVDEDGSSVEFAARTFWGLTTVRGRFDRFAGSYETGPDGTSIQLTIDADSLDTGNRTRDGHLRADGFFHVEEHPVIRFTSTRVHPVDDETLNLVGVLEAAGSAVTLEFPATVRRTDGGMEIEATTTVDQTRLGMGRGRLGMIRVPATLHVMARVTAAG